MQRTLISENGGSTIVTATLDKVPSADVRITVSTTPQTPALMSDYMLSPNTTLTITAGQTTSTGVVTITAVDNAVKAPAKTVVVQGTATSTENVIGPADVTLTIMDDDVLSLTAPASTVVPEGGSRNLPIALSSLPTADVTVTVIGHGSSRASYSADLYPHNLERSTDVDPDGSGGWRYDE